MYRIHPRIVLRSLETRFAAAVDDNDRVIPESSTAVQGLGVVEYAPLGPFEILPATITTNPMLSVTRRCTSADPVSSRSLGIACQLDLVNAGTAGNSFGLGDLACFQTKTRLF